jgi:hypothetical protein
LSIFARHDIEACYLIAVFEDRNAEAERLGNLLERRNTLGLRLVASSASSQKEDELDPCRKPR